MQDRALEKLLDFIANNFQVEKEDIELDKSLIDEGVIDSFGFIEITAYLGREFGIEISDTEMSRDNFGSVRKIAAYVSRKTAG